MLIHFGWGSTGFLFKKVIMRIPIYILNFFKLSRSIYFMEIITSINLTGAEKNAFLNSSVSEKVS